MKARTFNAVLVACVSSLAPASFAQAPKPTASHTSVYAAPKTPFGHPNLEGIWTSNFMTILEGLPDVPLVLPEKEAQEFATRMVNAFAERSARGLDPELPEIAKATEGLPIVRGERRTRTVVEPADGILPYTPEARKESKAGPVTKRYDNPEERPAWERCLVGLAVPPVTNIGAGSLNPRQIFQTSPEQIIIHSEYGDEARIIPFANTHKPKVLHTALGDSIARWEGETLVVETVSLPEVDRVRLVSNLVVTKNSKVIERLTRLSDNELLYQYTVEDPAIYTAPWSAEYSLYRTDQRMFESSCHEGNYALSNILKGGRVADKWR
ncbi:MAG: hypothetical protein IPO30_07960 [Hyphomonadaceae bacterium]|nr:hypothetical protein [Hyphomonadaceae bacterium]